MANIRESVTKLVPLLERLSLLKINDQALERVIRCVEYSSTISENDPNCDLKPMISPTENDCVFMRKDEAFPANQTETLANATQLVEEYFVTPSKHKHYSNI